MTTDSNNLIKAKEGSHAKAISKTAAEKRITSRKTQSGIIQAIRFIHQRVAFFRRCGKLKR
jgi:hypothetical protein